MINLSIGATVSFAFIDFTRCTTRINPRKLEEVVVEVVVTDAAKKLIETM